MNKNLIQIASLSSKFNQKDAKKTSRSIIKINLGQKLMTFWCLFRLNFEDEKATTPIKPFSVNSHNLKSMSFKFLFLPSSRSVPWVLALLTKHVTSSIHLHGADHCIWQFSFTDTLSQWTLLSPWSATHWLSLYSVTKTWGLQQIWFCWRWP